METTELLISIFFELPTHYQIIISIISLLLLCVLIPVIAGLFIGVCAWFGGVIKICLDFPRWLYKLPTGKASLTLLEPVGGLILLLLGCAGMLLIIGLVLVLPLQGFDKFINYIGNVWVVVWPLALISSIGLGVVGVVMGPICYLSKPSKQ